MATTNKGGGHCSQNGGGGGGQQSKAAGKLWLPTYGFKHPAAIAEKGMSSSSSFKFFRPVEFNSNGESEDEESAATRSSSNASLDSAYSSQSDLVMNPLFEVKIEAKLHKKSLWKGFMNLGNEMIVTKPGRYIHLIKFAR